MADKNIQMTQRNTTNTDWDNIFPKTKAANVDIADASGQFTATNVEGALSELFTSVGNGKNSLETAVIDKEGVVSKAGDIATFAELDAGIRGIPTGPPQGSQTFTSSGTFIPPAGVEYVDVFLVGGGGSGGRGDAGAVGGNGGGGGYTLTVRKLPVIPGKQYAVTIGAGGMGASYGNDGTATSFISESGTVTAAGGIRGNGRGEATNYTSGSFGGSGGGSSSSKASYTNGASDGASAGHRLTVDYYAEQFGAGQNTTTRRFGLPNGTLYSGGGGGGNYYDGGGYGIGGAGGGGRGGTSNGISATASTGGGGGGGGVGSTSYIGGTGANGIAIISWG